MLLFLSALGITLVAMGGASESQAKASDMPFAPEERLKYQLRWGSIPAGEAMLEVLPVTSLNGVLAYHFVMTAKTNGFIDIFYKVRDRVDAFADLEMTRSLRYVKKQREGRHKRDVVVEFDWVNQKATYSNYGQKNESIQLIRGSFDPLSIFYYTRTLEFKPKTQVECPVTDGKKNVIGRLAIVRRETIKLRNGKTYDTYLAEPEMKEIGGVFEESKDAKLQLWVTADEKRLLVRVKSKVIIGHFIAELVSAEGT